MSKHTPGPWKVETYSGPMFAIVRDPEEGMTPEPRTEHDRRLIEAAPDLLEALEKISAAIDLYGNHLHEKLDGVQQVREVIAKARGEK